MGVTATVTSFPLSKHTGGGEATPAFSGWHVYLLFTWEVGLPPSPVAFSSHRHFYKLSCLWLLSVCCRSCLVWLVCLFAVPWGIAPPRSLVLRLIIQFFFLFSLGGGQSVQGAMLIWLRVVCGSTMCCLAHLVVCVLPSCLGAGIWQHRSPPGFFI
jgi:hypothetical protein